MQYGLKKENIEKIKQVLASIIEIDEAILYGSRAKGNFKLGSDIDLTLKGKDLSSKILDKVSVSLDDIMLPYTFDVSIFTHIKNQDLIEHINRVGISFYKKQINKQL